MNTWYTIRNGLDATAPTDIYIDNEIGEFGIPARAFLNELKAIGTNPVKLHINSPGGSLIDAFAIYDFVKLKGYKVTTYIHGIAASAATIVSLAGQETFIGEHSYFFIHNPFFSQGKGGQQSDLQKMKNDILDIYAKKTGLDKMRLSDMMDQETLLNATEALDLGFVDGIAREAKVAALRHRQESLEKLTHQFGKNIVLNDKFLAANPSSKEKGGLLERIMAKVGEVDRKIKRSLLGNDPAILDFMALNTADGKTFYVLPAKANSTQPRKGDAAYADPATGSPLANGKYKLKGGKQLTIKNGIITTIINQKTMQDTQEIQQQLEALVQQLNDLLQQYFSQDAGEDGGSPDGQDPAAPPAKPGSKPGTPPPAAKNELKQRDETIRQLKQELARYKARRVENRHQAGDHDPDGANRARNKGWNYVSNYLQNSLK